MNILIDINHPADVHQFKHLISMLRKDNNILVVARNKECTQELLNKCEIPYVPRKGYKGILGKALGLLLIEKQLYSIAKKNKIDLFIGSSGDVYIAHVAWLMRKTSILFDDTEHAHLQKKLSFPFVSKIIVPQSYYRAFTKSQERKVIRYDGYKELAYLSPQYFKKNNINIGKKPNILLRLVSWEAAHDKGHKGIQQINHLIQELSQKGTLHISSEKAIPHELQHLLLKAKPEDFHQSLANMDLVISEGGTVAAESAVLGIPTIYVNSLKMGYTNDLVAKGLLIQSTNIDEIIATAKSLLNTDEKIRLQKKQKEILKSKPDINKLMKEVVLSCKKNK